MIETFRKVHEVDVQRALELITGGAHARVADTNRIVDILSDYYLIEIKNWDKAYIALDQVDGYARYFPYLKKRVVLFGERPSRQVITKVMLEATRRGIEIEEFNPLLFRCIFRWSVSDEMLRQWMVPVNAVYPVFSDRERNILHYGPNYLDPADDVPMHGH
jgi:hypothetical protein